MLKSGNGIMGVAYASDEDRKNNITNRVEIVLGYAKPNQPFVDPRFSTSSTQRITVSSPKSNSIDKVGAKEIGFYNSKRTFEHLDYEKFKKIIISIINY